MEIKNEIKSYIVKTGKSLTEVVELINVKYGKSESVSNLSNKLTRGTIKYREALEIADVLGYKILWEKKEN